MRYVKKECHFLKNVFPGGYRDFGVDLDLTRSINPTPAWLMLMQASTTHHLKLSFLLWADLNRHNQYFNLKTLSLGSNDWLVASY